MYGSTKAVRFPTLICYTSDWMRTSENRAGNRNQVKSRLREECEFSPHHSQGSCVAVAQIQVSVVFYQTTPCRTFHRYLRENNRENIYWIHSNMSCWSCGCVAAQHLHFPLKTAISGLNFFNFSTRIFPPSRNSLLLRWEGKCYRCFSNERGLGQHVGVPWEIFASWRCPGHHVGETHFVLDRQGGVVHVVELLLSKSWQKQALPWKKKYTVTEKTRRNDEAAQ